MKTFILLLALTCQLLQATSIRKRQVDISTTTEYSTLPTFLEDSSEETSSEEVDALTLEEVDGASSEGPDVASESTITTTIAPDETTGATLTLDITTPEPKPDNITRLNGTSGMIVSKNFPEPYASYTNEIWIITVDEGYKVEFTFHLLNIESNPGCTWDFIVILDSNNTVIKKICGYLQQDDLALISTGNNMTIHFRSDRIIQKPGFLGSWKATKSDKVSVKMPSDTTYLLTIPQTFAASDETSPEKVCLQLFNVKTSGTVEVDLLSTNNIIKGSPDAHLEIEHSPKEATNDIECYEMKLNSSFSSSYAVVRVRGSFGDYQFLSYKAVKVLKVQPMILIQTDRGDYQPEQKVFIRVFKLNSVLKPSVNDVIEEISIENPEGSRLAQYLNVSLDKGMAQMEFSSGEEPLLGKWSIHVKDDDKSTKMTTFTISESVLPKFEVKINSPEAILGSDAEATFEICGIYTHGNKVSGRVNVTFSHTYHRQSRWHTETISFSKTGKVIPSKCGNVSLNNTEIEILTQGSGKFTIFASLEEQVTGIKHNATVKQTVQFTPYKITFVGSAKTHIVGEFPYKLSVQFKDHFGVSLDGIKTEVCSRLFRDIEALRRNISEDIGKLYSTNEDGLLDFAEKVQHLQYKVVCSNYTTDENGQLFLRAPLHSLPTDISKLGFRLRVPSYKPDKKTRMQTPDETFDVTLSHSDDSEVALTIHETNKPVMKCSDQAIRIIFTASANDTPIDLSYMISSGGALLLSGVDTASPSSREDVVEDILTSNANVVDFDLKRSESETPVRSHQIIVKRPFANEDLVSEKIKLLVMTRLQNGRFLATSEEYAADSCAATPVLGWSAKKVNPSDEVSLNITYGQPALCGYSVIDKSAALVANPNTITTPKLLKLKEDVARSRIVNDHPRYEKCLNANLLYRIVEQLGLYVMGDNLLHDPDCDSIIDVKGTPEVMRNVIYQAYQSFGFPAVSLSSSTPLGGAPMATAAFNNAPPRDRFVEADSVKRLKDDPSEASIEKSKIELRNYFPETWLFDLISLNDTGFAELKLSTPHTITTWVGSAICSGSSGLVASEISELLVSQDFFVDLNLPYAVKRGEIVSFTASVTNTVGQSLPISLKLISSKYYKAKGQDSHDVCVKSQTNTIQPLKVEFNELGSVNITVSASLKNGIECATVEDSVDGYADTIQDQLLVKPEGFPHEVVKSEFICSRDDEVKSIKLDDVPIPKDLVQGSLRSYFYVTGDIMAPNLRNPGRLVRLPTGCGEQNLVRMVPNIYLYEYIQQTGISEPTLESKALQYISIGYKRQKKYKLKDGSYSIWGREEDGGSMWLTAYTMKAFIQASKYITIPSKDIQSGISWMLAQQDGPSGCFFNVGYAYSVNSRPDSLTAHVLITLLEAKMIDTGHIRRIPREVYENAFKCLARSVHSDTYGLALKTYATSLLDKLPSTFTDGLTNLTSGELIKEVLSTGNTSDYLFWTDSLKGRSYSIEATGYNVMSLSINGHLSEALEGIKWLTKQRNSRGGFYSTQDTVVGIQALSVYSLQVHNNGSTDLTIEANSGTYKINDVNKLLLQSQKLNTNEAVSIEASGRGCFMVQQTTRYNTQESKEVNNFKLTVESNATHLTVCSAYTGPKEKTDMALIEVELLTGYSIDESSAEILLNEVDSDIEKYEINEKDGLAVFYYNRLTAEERCFTVGIFKTLEVENLKPATVSVYDYYEQEDKVTTDYIV